MSLRNASRQNSNYVIKNRRKKYAEWEGTERGDINDLRVDTEFDYLDS